MIQMTKEVLGYRTIGSIYGMSCLHEWLMLMVNVGRKGHIHWPYLMGIFLMFIVMDSKNAFGIHLGWQMGAYMGNCRPKEPFFSVRLLKYYSANTRWHVSEPAVVDSAGIAILLLPSSSSPSSLLFRSTPHPVTVTTRIITFLVGNPYKPSFATVTGWGVDPNYCHHHVTGYYHPTHQSNPKWWRFVPL